MMRNEMKVRLCGLSENEWFGRVRVGGFMVEVDGRLDEVSEMKRVV